MKRFESLRLKTHSGRATTVTSALLLAGSLSVAQALEVLNNGTLDVTSVSSQANATPTGWVVEATKTTSGEFTDGASSEPWCNVADPGGFGLFMKPFQGNQGSGDLLNVFFYQDNPAAPGTKFTFSGYAAAEANYSGLKTDNDPPSQTLFIVEFLDAGGSVLSSNSLDLVTAGLPAGGPSSMAEFIMPEVTAPPLTATVRSGAAIFNVYSTTGAQSFFVDAFSLDAAVSAGAPVIDTQPVDVSVAPGGTAKFSVRVGNPTGATYQWQRARANLSNGGNIAGATSDSLTVSNVSAAELGSYRVLVTNPSGSVISSEVSLTSVGISFSPVILINGKVGDTYRIDYATSLAPTTWIPLSTNKLTTAPQPFVDLNWLQSQARYYQAVRVP